MNPDSKSGHGHAVGRGLRRTDARGYPVTGATSAALLAYEDALESFQSGRDGVQAALAIALTEAPRFVMAYVLAAYVALSGRDPRSVERARPILSQAHALDADARERGHVDAIAAMLADDYDTALRRLDALILEYPLDLPALLMAQAIDLATGSPYTMRERMQVALPAWAPETRGYSGVLAMHAFSLVECGEYASAERAARAVLERYPTHARALHAIAHVFEMTDRPAQGERWMARHRDAWANASSFRVHCGWHLALFALSQDQSERALAMYDEELRSARSHDLSNLIDATSLLWRLELKGTRVARRFNELAEAWSHHIDDHHCTFNDVHAILAFAGAGRWDHAARLEAGLAQLQHQPNRHAVATREFGLAACRGVIAFGRGEHARAIGLLGGLPAQAHRLGGSHAQRDALHLTLLHAIEAVRRPRRGPLVARLGVRMMPDEAALAIG